MLAQALDAPAHVAKPLAKRATFSCCEAFEKRPVRSPQRQIMLTRETGSVRTVLSGARPVTSHQVERSRVQFRIRVRADMRHAREPFVRAVKERYRAPDIPQRPRRDR